MESIFLFLDENLILIYLLIFTIILGFELISNVPTILHTPLMSGANAISGVVIIGAILLIRNADPSDYLTLSLGALGVVLGSGACLAFLRKGHAPPLTFWKMPKNAGS